MIEVIEKTSCGKNKMNLKKITRRDFLDMKPNIYNGESVRDVWGEKRDINLRIPPKRFVDCPYF
jgi:hypothetical protein